MKVSGMEGALLDYWVGVALTGRRPECGFFEADDIDLNCGPHEDGFFGDRWQPSFRWGHGGPIIEREIAFLTRHGPTKWSALANGSASGHGPTPLVAAMRAYVASEFGDEVPDNPE